MKVNKFSLLMIIALCFSIVGVFAEGPQGLRDSDVTTSSQRFDSTSWAPYNTTAIAGNITEMIIHSWTLTRTWAGFYGNITGTIVLADTNNYTMYDWNDNNPNGRVYASRTNTVDWPTIACASYDELSDDEATFTLTNGTDRDGKFPVDRPNATFVNSTNYNLAGVDSQFANYSRFWVGPVQINGTNEAGECFSTVMHNSTGYVKNDQNAGNDQNRFREVVLADANGDGNIVYTAILEKNYLGFDQRNHDFQMIVGENGHGTDTTSTNYYFYIELE